MTEQTKVEEIKEEKPTPKKRGRGRPRKTEVEAKKKGNRGKVGRPAGDASRINEFKARLLATSGDAVINKIIQIAMDDDHQGQMAALKMCMDRVLPLSYFEKKSDGSAKPSITINISSAVEESGEAKTIEYSGAEPELIEYNNEDDEE